MILSGFLLQWPAILAVAIFPVPVWMHVRLARQEERQSMRRRTDQKTSQPAAAPALDPGP